MKTLSFAAALAAAALLLAPTIATAASNKANAPGQNKDALITYYQTVDPTGSPASDTGLIKNLGGAISGGFFGNTSNSGVDPDAPANGHGVTPSISPGPQVNGGGFCSLGDFMHTGCQ